MRSLSDTLARLKRLPRAVTPHFAPVSSRLQPFDDFGANPGELSAWVHVPASAGPGAPLVVVLHGCTQNAAGYDDSAGWSRLADEAGFVLLFPEQQRGNNPNLCFTWFSAEDAARGRGEAMSIRSMVAAAQARFGTDPARVFVTGLSAGGAMTAAMLASYPDVFAGGAVIAGLPFGVAQSVPEAFDRMRGHGLPSPGTLTELVRRASPHAGPWPTLSVWHGTADRTVDEANAAALIAQWRGLHGAADAPAASAAVGSHIRRLWRDPAGRAVIEQYQLAGLGHGTPLDPGSAHGEKPAPFMLDAGISSTRRIANFWGIVSAQAAASRAAAAAAAPEQPAIRQPESAIPGRAAEIGRTIEDALRSAGLMK